MIGRVIWNLFWEVLVKVKNFPRLSHLKHKMYLGKIDTLLHNVAKAFLLWYYTSLPTQ